MATPRFPRYLLGALIALPLLWLAMKETTFRTRMEIEVSPDQVRMTVNGQSLQINGGMTSLKSVAIEAAPSFFPTGLEQLRIAPEGGFGISLRAPGNFRFQGAKRGLTGDWWEDRWVLNEQVFQQAVPVDGNFTIHAIFTGRSLRNTEVVLHGDTTVRAYFRAGSLNNDLGIILDNGARIDAPLAHFPGVDSVSLLGTISAGLLAACLLIVIFHVIGRWLHRTRSWSPRVPWNLFGIAAIVSSCLTGLWVAWAVLDARPHFQDDLGYLLRAKWLLAGHLSMDIPTLSQHFAIPWTAFAHGRWMSQYPIGWPALLALGESVNAAWAIAPVCYGVFVFAAWKLARECAGTAAAAWVAVLAAVSPLGLTLAGSMLSHAAAAMWITLFVWLYVKGWRDETQGRLWLGLGGLALGLAFTTRPLAAFSVAVPAGVYGLAEMSRLHFSRGARQAFLVFLIGGVVGSLPQLIDNYCVSGHPFTFAYAARGEGWALKEIPSGILLADRTLAQVPGAAFGWGWPYVAGSPILYALSFVGIVIPFLTGRAQRTDWLMLGLLVSIPLAYLGYNGGTSLHGFGPRYYADVFFAFFILTVRGYQILGELVAPRLATRILAAALPLTLSFLAALQLSDRLALARSYNRVDDRLERLLAEQNVQRGLIILKEPIYLLWISAARLLPVSLKADLVFAQDCGDNRALIAEYADRPVYLTDGEILKRVPATSPPDAP